MTVGVRIQLGELAAGLTPPLRCSPRCAAPPSRSCAVGVDGQDGRLPARRCIIKSSRWTASDTVRCVTRLVLRTAGVPVVKPNFRQSHIYPTRRHLQIYSLHQERASPLRVFKLQVAALIAYVQQVPTQHDETDLTRRLESKATTFRISSCFCFFFLLSFSVLPRKLFSFSSRRMTRPLVVGSGLKVLFANQARVVD
ncbi:hypothetical protein MKEN_01366400 [Mycena kentingensis (nom. inval.)]|nr:hypothetical protein MKEN_01366400 [Mycena kentingensis (nom. inval.)]